MTGMGGSRGGGGGGGRVYGPPERSQKKVFLAILVRIPWKIAKLLGQNSMLDHHRDASETPFKWRFSGGLMMARFKWYFDHLSSHQQKKHCQS